MITNLKLSVKIEVEDLKSLWNKVRNKKTTDSERDSTIPLILSKLQGNLATLSLRHDVARVIQYIIQYGNDSQRKAILLELLPKFSEIAKTPYEQSKICHSVKSHLVSIGTNVIGARIVELLLSNYPNKLKKSLKSEFYGHKFTVLLPEACNNLHNLMTTLPNKESAILDHTRDLTQRFVEKGLLVFKYVHSLIWEYLCEITNKPKRLNDFIEMTIDNYAKLLSTKTGSKVACVVTTYCQPKDRKKIIKSLKGSFTESLLSTISYLPIIRLIDVTDDTVNIQKTLLSSLRSVTPIVKYTATGEVIGVPEPILTTVFKHKYASKLLLRLLDPNANIFEPDEVKLFANPTDIKIYKKDPLARCKEHLIYLKSPLLYISNKYLPELVRCPNGNRVIEYLVKRFYSPDLIANIARAYVGLELLDPEYVDNEQLDDPYVEDVDEQENDENDMGDDDIPNEADKRIEECNNTINYWDEDVNEEEPTVEEEKETVILPIHEDKNAHRFLKALLKFELTLTKSPDDIIRLWDDEPVTSLAAELSNQLTTNDYLTQWISSNRACLILCDLIKISSAAAVISNLSEDKHLSVLKSSKHKGGQLLYETILSHIPKNKIANSEKKIKKSK
eukprot:gene17378-22926_t